MSTVVDERFTLPSKTFKRVLPIAGSIALFVILVLQLVLSIRRETQPWDGASHIFAGYSYWTRGDFGMNPEHPRGEVACCAPIVRNVTAGASPSAGRLQGRRLHQRETVRLLE